DGTAIDVTKRCDGIHGRYGRFKTLHTKCIVGREWQRRRYLAGSFAIIAVINTTHVTQFGTFAVRPPIICALSYDVHFFPTPSADNRSDEAIARRIPRQVMWIPESIRIDFSARSL